MWILVAEAMGALGLFLFIVWWTLGPTQRREREALDRLVREEAGQRAAIRRDPQRSEAADAEAARAGTTAPRADEGR